MKNRYKNDDIWCFDEKYYNYFRICFVLKISRSMIRQFQYFIRACSHPRGLNFIWRKVFRRQRCLTPINIMIANSTNFPARFGSDRGPLKRRILQKQISYGIGSNRIWEGEEKGRFIGGGGKRLKNFSNFFIRQLFPFMRVICTDPLFFFFPFFPSPPLLLLFLLLPPPVRYQKQRLQRRQRKQISFFRRKIEARDGMARYGFPINRWKVSILRLDDTSNV